MKTTDHVRIGTRGSNLARRQTEMVISRLQQLQPGLQVEVHLIKTTGDNESEKPLAEFGGRGIFTHEIERALLAGEIDLAVHSLKDLPTQMVPGLVFAALLERENPLDCWICPAGYTWQNLPAGSIVGTSSTRRSAQMLALRPDLHIAPLRGNIDTRLAKVQAGLSGGQKVDAIILAAAGLIRLGREADISAYFPPELMVPDPGQGALAVETRATDADLIALLAGLDHPATRAAVTAERAFLQALGGGCATPAGAYGQVTGDVLTLQGTFLQVIPGDGQPRVHTARGEITGPIADATTLGELLARQLLAQHPLLRPLSIFSLGLPEQVAISPLVSPDHRPLLEAQGQRRRILITRPPHQAAKLATQLEMLGALAVICPTIEIAPPPDWTAVDGALAEIERFAWVVFTSANGVESILARLRETGRLKQVKTLLQNQVGGDARARALAVSCGRRTGLGQVRLAAIGPGTAAALADYGLPVAFMPTTYLTAQVAAELPIIPGERVLLLRADIATPELAQVLQERGAQVANLCAYRTLAASSTTALEEALAGGIDGVTFTSASTVRYFVELLAAAKRRLDPGVAVFCIGPVTASAARDHGLSVQAVAEDHTIPGLVAAIVKYYNQHTPQGR
ncbi:MAG: hydroxymethylbilane synthase [Chloroflexi bacterium]|nr:hydroxymethylbilane synthase [Chloroflexota bacterium]